LNKVNPKNITSKPEFTRNYGIFAIKIETFNFQKSVSEEDGEDWQVYQKKFCGSRTEIGACQTAYRSLEFQFVICSFSEMARVK
jgi:hypothetical protein